MSHTRFRVDCRAHRHPEHLPQTGKQCNRRHGMLTCNATTPTHGPLKAAQHCVNTTCTAESRRRTDTEMDKWQNVRSWAQFFRSSPENTAHKGTRGHTGAHNFFRSSPENAAHEGTHAAHEGPRGPRRAHGAWLDRWPAARMQRPAWLSRQHGVQEHHVQCRRQLRAATAAVWQCCWQCRLGVGHEDQFPAVKQGGEKEQ